MTATRAPGETYASQLEVSNFEPRPLRLGIDGVDGLATPGGTVFANATDPKRGAGAWITPEKTTVKLAARSSRLIDFEVQVPRDAKPGKHVGAIAFETSASPGSAGRFSVSQIARVVIAVEVDVRPRKAEPPPPQPDRAMLSSLPSGGAGRPTTVAALAALLLLGSAALTQRRARRRGEPR